MNNTTHIILIALLLLLVLFGAHIASKATLSQPPPTGPIIIDETRFINIIRASWGENCDGQKRRVSTSVTLGLSEQGTYETPYYEVEENNAYQIVSEKCNDQSYCDLTATSGFLGFDPAPHCTKLLTIEYRCFSYDKPWVKQAKEKQSMHIDCSDKPQIK